MRKSFFSFPKIESRAAKQSPNQKYRRAPQKQQRFFSRPKSEHNRKDCRDEEGGGEEAEEAGKNRTPAVDARLVELFLEAFGAVDALGARRHNHGSVQAPVGKVGHGDHVRHQVVHRDATAEKTWGRRGQTKP